MSNQVVLQRLLVFKPFFLGYFPWSFRCPLLPSTGQRQLGNILFFNQSAVTNLASCFTPRFTPHRSLPVKIPTTTPGIVRGKVGKDSKSSHSFNSGPWENLWEKLMHSLRCWFQSLVRAQFALTFQIFLSLPLFLSLSLPPPLPPTPKCFRPIATVSLLKITQTCVRHYLLSNLTADTGFFEAAYPQLESRR